MGDFMMVFNEAINMSELPINPAPQTLPVNNGTNGNGRAGNSSAPAASSSISTTDKPKATGIANSRNYIRKPINKK
jgi:hypothetical protein